MSKLPWPLWPLGRGAEAPALLSEAEAIARTLADPAILAHVLYNRAAIMSHSGRPDVASPLADEALAWATAAADPWLLAMAAWARATAACSANESGRPVSSPSALRERVDQAAILLEKAGNVYHRASVFQRAAHASLCSGRDDEATRYLQRAAPLVRELDQPYLSILVRGRAGLAALFTGDTEAARHAFREELTLCRELVILPAASRGLSGLAAVAVLDDDLDRAARLTGAAAAHRYGDPQDVLDARLHATFSEPARTRFGTDAWNTSVREGAALSFKDAIAYALDERPEVGPRLEPVRVG